MALEIEVFGDEEKKQEPLRLKLGKALSGGVMLRAVDAHGRVVDAGNILVIGRDGVLRLCTNINPGLGLNLDDAGRIIQGLL